MCLKRANCQGHCIITEKCGGVLWRVKIYHIKPYLGKGRSIVTEKCGGVLSRVKIYHIKPYLGKGRSLSGNVKRSGGKVVVDPQPIRINTKI